MNVNKLPITILDRTANSVLYELPPGKPNPDQPCTADSTIRDRVRQSAQKGLACEYYTLNFIRRRIGNKPSPEFAEARRIEKICSQRRKNLDLLDRKLPAELFQQIPEGPQQEQSSEGLERQKEFVASLKECWLEFVAEQKSKKEAVFLCDLADCEGNIGRCLAIVKGIRNPLSPEEKKTAENFYQFLSHKKNEQYCRIESNFFDSLDLTVSPSAAQDFDLSSAEKLKHFFRNGAYNSCAEAYNLERSYWKPVDGMSKLIDALNQKGPLAIRGYFGVSQYIDPPFQLQQQVKGRDIYGWRPEAKRREGLPVHSVLLVGAKKVQNQELVYFIDPNDPSDPQDRTLQKIYVISFKNLISNIGNVAGFITQDSPKGYGYHGNFDIPSQTLSK